MITKFSRTAFCLLTIIFLFSHAGLAAERDMVLFPLAIYVDQSKTFLHQGLRSMLLSRLSGEDIKVTSEERMESILGDEDKKGITSKERAEELTKSLKAHYALFGSVTSVGAAYSLDLTLLDMTKDPPGLTRISEVVEEDKLISKLADLAYEVRGIIEGRPYVPARRAEYPAASPEPVKGLTKKGQKSISGPTIEAFDTADLNGDGAPEWLVLGRQELQIYSNKEGKHILKDSLKPSRGEVFLKVSAGDADMNGRPEIYLVTLYGQRVRTVVWEWDGTFKRLFDIPGNVELLRAPIQEGPLLLFQDSRPNEPFYGDIYKMEYEQGGLTRKEPLNLKKAQICTLILFDVNKDGNMEYLGLGDDSYLYIWDQLGKSLWDSGERMGGTNHAIQEERKRYGPPEPSFLLNSRVVLMDIDKDGKEEVLVVKNDAELGVLADLKLYTKGVVIAFKADGTGLAQTWTSPTVRECIVDMQTDGKTLYLATQKGKRSYISRGSGHIVWFE